MHMYVSMYIMAMSRIYWDLTHYAMARASMYMYLYMH
jgi:hypothetical protein